MIEVKTAKQLHRFSASIPGSKSYTNRALLLASLAEGESSLINPLSSDDTRVMIKALKQLGVVITIDKNVIKVKGMGSQFRKTVKPLYLGNAGTAVRSLTAVLATQKFPATITGNARMQQRPIKDLTDALSKLGAKITTNKGCPPVSILQSLKGGKTTVKGNISSQYLSALLIAAPLAEKEVTIKVRGKLTSKPYVQMTLDAMKKFGVTVRHSDFTTFKVSPQKYKATKYEVEADASSATYPLALAAIHGTEVTINNLDAKTKQADIKFLEILKKMGCKVTAKKSSTTVKGPVKLKPLGTINLNELPDAAMTVAILCAFAKGKSTLTGLANLRVKETDRLHALATELTKIGAKVKEGKSSLIIDGSPEELHGGIIETYDDHRMAMCFAVAASKVPNIKILGPKCVAKTYPDFWKDFRKWGVSTSRIKPKTNIVLCGLRGSGKSTVGSQLAEKLGYKFIDTDQLIEQKNRSKIAKIIEDKGWDYFRKLENVTAKKLAASSSTVISTGGGMFINPDNIKSLRKKGYVILLNGRAETLAKRIEKDGNRPRLTSHGTLIKEFEHLWQERKHNYYGAADCVINIENLSQKKLLAAVSKQIQLILDT